jgi:hypothetical protein
MDKIVKVVATFTYRMDADDINTDNIDVALVQSKVNDDGIIGFDSDDGDSCVINSVEVL